MVTSEALYFWSHSCSLVSCTFFTDNGVRSLVTVMHDECMQCRVAYPEVEAWPWARSLSWIFCKMMSARVRC